ncbi:MAG: AAA family ATPase, partial [Paludibacteraceae bacterium]|nr:AAA family ATPase [Paludibacteraceae bacterium]
MAEFINLGNSGFARARNGEYVDKSALIRYVNSTLRTERQFTCVCRSRRFGKSMAAKMLCAYYDKSCDSKALFDGLNISLDASYGKYLNKFPVIYLDITDFTTTVGAYSDDMIKRMDQRICADLQSVYTSVKINEGSDLMSYLLQVVEHTGEQFIMIIDEWDTICREAPKHQE